MVSNNVQMKYEQYLSKHSEYKLYKPEFVYQKMMEEGLLTEAEYKALKSSNVFSYSGYIQQPATNNYVFNGTPNNLLPPFLLNFVSKNELQYCNSLSEFGKEIETDKNGKVDFSKLTESAILKKYKNDKFNVEVTDDSGLKHIKIKNDNFNMEYTISPHTIIAIKDNKMIVLDKNTGKILSEQVKNELEIEKTRKKSKNIAQQLIKDIYGLGSGKLKEHLKQITPSNVLYVLEEYAKLSVDKLADYNEKIRIPGCEDTYFVSPYDGMEGLLCAINNEWGLFGGRETLINQIIDAVKKSPQYKNPANKDIVNDINKHLKDLPKLELDFIRLSHRPAINKKEIDKTEPNGKFDLPFNQGNIGDCWLISGLITILNNPKALAKLKSLIKYDKSTGMAQITIPGAKKTYKISKSEMQNANYLSEGDKDVRILEIAFDRLLKEDSYTVPQSEFMTYGLEGGYSAILYDFIFGNASLEIASDIPKLNKNYFKDKLCTLGYEEGDFQKTDKNEDSLMANHAYAVLSADDKYVYLYDPNVKFDPQNIDKSKLLKVTYNTLKKNNVDIQSCKV